MGVEHSRRSIIRESELDSLSLHLDYPAGAVIEVEEFIDETAGIMPGYYYQAEDSVFVSTSVLSLIDELGGFQPDQTFLESATPLTHDTSIGGASIPDIAKGLPKPVVNAVKPLGEPILNTLGLISTDGLWVCTNRTPDERIRKVPPFHRVTPSGTTRDFDATYSLTPREAAADIATHMQQFINRIEKEYPGYHHVVLTGGKDSQLIWLVDKVEPEKWHAASSPPNYSINREFFEENGISHNTFIKLNEAKQETREETELKIVTSDLRSDIRHLRWRPQQREIAERFDQQVIFWSGTVGGTLHSYHPDYAGTGRDGFFEAQFTRAANWQANAHQTVKNYSGCAKLSPYHSPEIWRSVYEQYDPGQIEKGDDFRLEIARELQDTPITWPSSNPSPAPYSYPKTLDPEEIYLRFVENMLEGNRDLDIFPS